MSELPPGQEIDNHIEALDAKVRELDEEVERIKRIYNNLKAEVIDLRGHLPAERKPGD